MSELFDDISRILARKIPRRQSLRLIAGGLAGGAVALLWPREPLRIDMADSPAQSVLAQPVLRGMPESPATPVLPILISAVRMVLTDAVSGQVEAQA